MLYLFFIWVPYILVNLQNVPSFDPFYILKKKVTVLDVESQLYLQTQIKPMTMQTNTKPHVTLD